ncbi:MAG: PTS sugar transporter subunit IIA, partial [Rhodothermia bacterium]
MPATGIQPATIGALLTEENVRLGVEASGKTALIRTLVAALASDPDEDLERVTEAVLEREAVLSTGVGYGVALPHAKTGGVDETRVLFAITASPIEFEAFDGEPVRLVFLIVGPARSSRFHIQILGRISRI